MCSCPTQPGLIIRTFYNSLVTIPSSQLVNSTIQMVLYDLGSHSLDILVNFFLKVPDKPAELIQRQRILLDILGLAEARGVQFAFPTQSLHIESLPGEKPVLLRDPRQPAFES